MGASHISNWRYGREEKNDLACCQNSDSANCATHGQHPTMHVIHASINTTTSCVMHAGPSKHCRLAGAKSSGDLPLYDHHACKCMGTQPTQSCLDSETLSGFWDINSVKAHCLLDSGCRGVMSSPDFIHAMGIVPIKLEQPIGLQLACMGSKSTINYGARSTITFGTARVEEYFDIANIDYYNVILCTPFLQRLNIILDFTSPGSICMGINTVPRNLPVKVVDKPDKVASCRPPMHEPL